MYQKGVKLINTEIVSDIVQVTTDSIKKPKKKKNSVIAKEGKPLFG